jgi:ligand-binding sensor domain-containing protein
VQFFRRHLFAVVLGALHLGRVFPDRRSLVLSVLSLLAAAPVEALSTTRTLAQHGHTGWRVKDGLLNGRPSAAAQTTNGYLWIGTGSGLLRFDGVRFTPLAATAGKLPSSVIVSLLAARDGSLLIGSTVGLVRLQGNRLESIGADAARINEMVEDRDLRSYGRPDGLGFDHATAWAADYTGRLWVGGASKVRERIWSDEILTTAPGRLGSAAQASQVRQRITEASTKRLLAI